MLITHLQPDQYAAFYEFNRCAYPAREQIESVFQFQILSNPLLRHDCNPRVLVACDDNGAIVGQIKLSPFEFHYGGNVGFGHWGWDYYVAAAARGRGVGTQLAEKVLAEYSPKFSIGPTPASEAIWTRKGGKHLGSLDYFVWLRNPLVGFKALGARLSTRRPSHGRESARDDEFPTMLQDGDVVFRRATSPPDDWKDDPWNVETLRLVRSREFLQWRFFSACRPYGFYVREDAIPPVYFAGRILVQKGLRLFAIVDYGVPEGDRAGFAAIIRAGKLLAKQCGYDGVFTASSHAFFDHILSRRFFVRVPHMPHPIVMNADLPIPDARIQTRTCVYATFVDFDKEFA